MRLSGYVPEGAINEAAAAANIAVELGMSRIWAGELAHDPFMPLAFAANAQPGLGIGTAIAVGFARSPYAVAEAAWDLARLSSGNFTLGLGTQVRAHIERRFGMTWKPPVSWLREYVGALRAIFATWQDGAPFRYEGQHYTLNLISAGFNPGPHPFPPPPIFLSGVNTAVCRLAGEVADGFLSHAFNSPQYLREIVVPALNAHGRKVPLIVIAFVGLGNGESEVAVAREDLRARIGFYASTPSYRAVLETHGLGDLGERLSAAARAQKWGELAEMIDDEVLDTFGIAGTPSQVGAELRRRYGGIADEVALYHSVDETTRAGWVDLLRAFNAAAA
jgi:probable F420-dependent oxidoreductase